MLFYFIYLSSFISFFVLLLTLFFKFIVARSFIYDHDASVILVFFSSSDCRSFSFSLFLLRMAVQPNFQRVAGRENGRKYTTEDDGSNEENQHTKVRMQMQFRPVSDS